MPRFPTERRRNRTSSTLEGHRRVHQEPTAARLRRAAPLSGWSGTRLDDRSPPAGGVGRATGRCDPPRARRPRRDHRERLPAGPREAVFGTSTIGSIPDRGRHPRPGARGLPRSGGGRRGRHDARILLSRYAAASRRHGRWRPLRSAGRCLDRRHGHGAGPCRQPGGIQDARLPGPDGPFREMVARRRLLVERRLLRHRKHDLPSSHPVPTDG